MNPDAWVVAMVVLTGGLTVILIPLVRGRRRRPKRGEHSGDGGLVAPFMIDGDRDRGDAGGDSDGGGDGGGD